VQSKNNAGKKVWAAHVPLVEKHTSDLEQGALALFEKGFDLETGEHAV
jgi:hypothetical protein